MISWWTTWSPIRRPGSLIIFSNIHPFYTVLRYGIWKSHESIFEAAASFQIHIWENIIWTGLNIHNANIYNSGNGWNWQPQPYQEREKVCVNIDTAVVSSVFQVWGPAPSQLSCKMVEKICVFVSTILSSLVIVNILVFYTNTVWKLRRGTTFFASLDKNYQVLKKRLNLPWTIYITMTLNRASFKVETNAVSCLMCSSWRFSYNPATFLL